MKKAILKVTNLEKRYDNKAVVKGISFEVKQGETFAPLMIRRREGS